MWRNTWLIAAVALSGCESAQAPIDPIAGVPVSQQRRVTKAELDWQWPLNVNVGTLGCDAGAVIFSNGPTAYALNDAARARGFKSIERLRLTVRPRPSNPLGRIPQETRMEIFARATSCDEDRGTRTQSPDICRQTLRDVHGLSTSELQQIEAEGTERRWPPLAPEYRTLTPLSEAGLKLCPVN